MFIQSQGFLTFDKGRAFVASVLWVARAEGEEGSIIFESVSWPNESLVGVGRRIELLFQGWKPCVLATWLTDQTSLCLSRVPVILFYLGSSRWSNDIYLWIIRIQTITYPSSVFLLYANRGFLYTAHQPYLFLTYNSTSITGFSEWTSFHITTLYTRFAFVLWRTRLPSTR